MKILLIHFNIYKNAINNIVRLLIDFRCAYKINIAVMVCDKGQKSFWLKVIIVCLKDIMHNWMKAKHVNCSQYLIIKLGFS